MIHRYFFDPASGLELYDMLVNCGHMMDEWWRIEMNSDFVNRLWKIELFSLRLE